MTTVTLSEKSKQLLQAIIDAPGKAVPDYAMALSVSIGQVSGALLGLKKAELVNQEDGKLTAIPNAATFLEYGEFDAADVKSGTTPGVTKVTAKLVEPTELASEEDLGVDVGIETLAAPAGITEMETSTEAPSIVEPVIETTGAVAVVEAIVETAAPAKTVSVGSAMAAIAASGGSVVVASAAPVTESKAAKARAIFVANPNAPRKVLMALMTGPDVGLTVAGANTYIYNFRKEAGLVVARGTEVKAALPVVAAAPAFVAETTAAIEPVTVDVSATTVTDTAAEGTGIAAEAIAE